MMAADIKEATYCIVGSFNYGNGFTGDVGRNVVSGMCQLIQTGRVLP
jgi:hypothetical protein